VKKSTPYLISLSIGKLQKNLDACEPMDRDVFNMVGCILAPRVQHMSLIVFTT
jgi:hypothetical protein